MSLPLDSYFQLQWYLYNTGQSTLPGDTFTDITRTPGVDLNVVNVWNDYTGRGVRIGVVDDGVDRTHPDLVGNVDSRPVLDPAYNYELEGAPDDGGHGTSVAGIIAARRNGSGVVGVAYNASITSYNIFSSRAQDEAIFLGYMRRQAAFDISSNSWGWTTPFADHRNSPLSSGYFAQLNQAIESAATNGRNGLGTIWVFAAGNERQDGISANYFNTTNSRHTIAVAALDSNGRVASFSSRGANVLVSAFGTHSIVTTDLTGNAGYNSSTSINRELTDTNYTSRFGGTSSATPMVSAVIALMLEANPKLGYRDVQEILAYSARQTDLTNPGWRFNGARNWNGGGLHVSHDYGFGLVDALAAVRLAETWQTQSTATNVQVVSGSSAPNRAINDLSTIADTIAITSGLHIDRIEVDINITHTYVNDLFVTLTSPDGTRSILLERAPVVNANQNNGLSGQGISFTFSSNLSWGEVGAGNWTLSVSDGARGDVGTLNNWTLRLYGDPITNNNTYIYTNEFGNLTDANRRILTDTTGTDTINAAAITSNLALNLTPGSSNSQLVGQFLTISANTVIENAFGGDGNDSIAGNAADNIFGGGRGNDVLFGGLGNDTLVGGAGNDNLIGSEGNDYLLGGLGVDLLMGDNGNDMLQGDAGADTLTGGAGADRFLYSGATQAVALAGSLVDSFDQITDFNAVEGDRIQLDFDNNLFTPNLPVELFSVGTLNAASLVVAADTAYSTVSLRANGAVLFGWQGQTYLSVNDNQIGFGATSDLVVQVGGLALPAVGSLSVSNYFV
jgi:subtilisin-like proprotein convertase family protein